MQPSNQFADLVKIIKILRKECPWDREQTHKSIKDNLIEEAYEAVDAIDREDFDSLKKELGDLLLHVVFHSRMAAEEQHFSIEDVIYSIQEKLIRRHPHVFGENEVKDEKDVAKNWETLKMKEGRESVLDGIPPHLPALIRAQRMQEKAGNVGFDWKRTENGKQQLWDKLQEELDEFKTIYESKSEDRNEVAREYGDFLFSVVNAGRFLGLQSEDALRLTNKKFMKRFRYIEGQVRASDRSLAEVSLDELEDYWQEAKKAEG